MQKQEGKKEGVRICRKQGHLKNKHYNTQQNRIEFRCSRCGRLLGIEEDKCLNSS